MNIESLIGQYAFPAAVCVWLLYERNGAMKELKQAIETNTSATIELLTWMRKK